MKANNLKKFNFAITDNSEWIGQDLLDFYSNALLKFNTASALTVIPNVKSYKRIPSYNLGNIIFTAGSDSTGLPGGGYEAQSGGDSNGQQGAMLALTGADGVSSGGYATLYSGGAGYGAYSGANIQVQGSDSTGSGGSVVLNPDTSNGGAVQANGPLAMGNGFSIYVNSGDSINCSGLCYQSGGWIYSGGVSFTSGANIVSGGLTFGLSNLIYDTTSSSSIDPNQRYLIDASSNVSVDYSDRWLRDSSSLTSVDYGTRTLVANDGVTPIFNWASSTYPLFYAIPQIPGVRNTANKTTVNCATSGTVIFSQPEQGSSYKKVVAHASACVGAASYAFPVNFSYAPSIVSLTNNAIPAGYVTTLGTNTVTVTGVTSTTGNLIIEGM